jgi:hypothetical protein
MVPLDHANNNYITQWFYIYPYQQQLYYTMVPFDHANDSINHCVVYIYGACCMIATTSRIPSVLSSIMSRVWIMRCLNTST